MRKIQSNPSFLSAVSLDDAVVDPWMKATRYGRVDFAEACYTSDSLLSGAVTSLGCHAVQYSHWNGFDLTTKAGTDKLKEDLPEKRPRVVWINSPCTTQRSQQSQSRSRFHRVQMNILAVFLSFVKQDWCEAILEQTWGSTSLGRGGVFSEWKEQSHSGRSPGCQWGGLTEWNVFFQNPGFSSAHINVGQICCVLDDVFIITLIPTLERETLRYTPQLV